MRAAPQNRMVTLMTAFSGSVQRQFRLQGVDEKIVERDGVGGMRHAVGRADRADAGLGESSRQALAETARA